VAYPTIQGDGTQGKREVPTSRKKKKKNQTKEKNPTRGEVGGFRGEDNYLGGGRGGGGGKKKGVPTRGGGVPPAPAGVIASPYAGGLVARSVYCAGAVKLARSIAKPARSASAGGHWRGRERVHLVPALSTAERTRLLRGPVPGTLLCLQVRSPGGAGRAGWGARCVAGRQVVVGGRRVFHFREGAGAL